MVGSCLATRLTPLSGGKSAEAQLAITAVVMEGRGKSEVCQQVFRHRLVGAEVHPARHQLAKVAGLVIAAAGSAGVTS
jgi:hypothetical protein